MRTRVQRDHPVRPPARFTPLRGFCRRWPWAFARAGALAAGIYLYMGGKRSGAPTLSRDLQVRADEVGFG